MPMTIKIMNMCRKPNKHPRKSLTAMMMKYKKIRWLKSTTALPTALKMNKAL